MATSLRMFTLDAFIVSQSKVQVTGGSTLMDIMNGESHSFWSHEQVDNYRSSYYLATVIDVKNAMNERVLLFPH